MIRVKSNPSSAKRRPLKSMSSKINSLFIAGFLILIAVCRIVSTYRATSQGFDEPCHVAAAIEFLDKHTYKLDPVHPPLSRIAIGLPLYLAGERFPHLQQNDPPHHDYNEVGNSVLYDSGHYLRNLSLARLGVLPFFVICAAVVFVWARREFGSAAALVSVALFTSVPTVLAFAGLAYSDMPTACTQTIGIFALILWLEKPSLRSTLFLGLALGLALASKLTSVLFLSSAGVLLAAFRWFALRSKPGSVSKTRWVENLTLALMLAAAVLWGTYGFQFGRVRESMELSSASMPSFQHFPGFVGAIAKECIAEDCLIPAPALLHGITEAWVLNKIAPSAYLFGITKNGGWWYFFLAALAVKTPIPFLILFVLGTGFVIRLTRDGWWTKSAPAVAVVAILLITMPVKYNAGLRHVLVLLPLMAVLGGYGALVLLQLDGRGRILARVCLGILLTWQCISTFQARHDYLAYFNAFAGKDPSRILVNGCDLDCGQDVFKVREELQRRQVSRFAVAMWSSADMSRMGLPDFTVLRPFQPVSGWIAISDRSRLEGDVFHTPYPANSFDWLRKYSPVARVGGAVNLYYIPESSASNFPSKTN